MALLPSTPKNTNPVRSSSTTVKASPSALPARAAAAASKAAASARPPATAVVARWNGLDRRYQIGIVVLVVSWFMPRQLWVAAFAASLFAGVGSLVVRGQWALMLRPFAELLRTSKRPTQNRVAAGADKLNHGIGKAYGWMTRPGFYCAIYTGVMIVAYPLWH